MTLKGKQAAFVDEYLKDLNASAAAVRAGYSVRTARFIGAENLTKPNIAAAIAAAQAERAQRTQIDADWVLKRLAAMADADLADLYRPDGSLLPVAEWPDVWRRGLVAGVEVNEERVGTEVVAELRKVIWPNRKQMVSYTTVVLAFLAFMVTMIGLVDLGLAKLVLLVFG